VPIGVGNGEAASRGGQQGWRPENPEWYHNLQADPWVELHDGTEHLQTRARMIEGAEREQWWSRCVEAFPTYADYQTATERQIPVFLLEPEG